MLGKHEFFLCIFWLISARPVQSTVSIRMGVNDGFSWKSKIFKLCVAPDFSGSLGRYCEDSYGPPTIKLESRENTAGGGLHGLCNRGRNYNVDAIDVYSYQQNSGTRMDGGKPFSARKGEKAESARSPA